LSEQPAGNGRDFGVVSLTTWRVGDIAAKHKLLLAGIGWGGMPEPMVRADIKSGKLVRLNLRDWRGGEYVMQAVHRTDTPPGPAGRWLIERVVALSAQDEASTLSQPAVSTTIRKRHNSSRGNARSRSK
jgi:DNA-binding transcriptional LysR family regulator